MKKMMWFIPLITVYLLTVPSTYASKGHIKWEGSGTVTANIWEGTHSNINFYTEENGYGTGEFGWKTDTYPDRGTALIGGVCASIDDGYLKFRNFIDFSETTGSNAEAYQTTEFWGSKTWVHIDAYRHQGYAMTRNTQIIVRGVNSELNKAEISIITELDKDKDGKTDNSYLLNIWSNKSVSYELNSWAHDAVRSQGITVNSDGGWGPTGEPAVTATGSGEFYEEIKGSTYTMLGQLGGSSMELPGGGTVYRGAIFSEGFSFTNSEAKADNGGI